MPAVVCLTLCLECNECLDLDANCGLKWRATTNNIRYNVTEEKIFFYNVKARNWFIQCGKTSSLTLVFQMLRHTDVAFSVLHIFLFSSLFITML